MTQLPAITPHPPRPRIFVVEDEAVIALDLLDRLRDLGYEPCGHAARGEEARRAIPRAQADVVLMDVHLGDGPDGIETARLLDLDRPTSIIFLSAYSDPALLSRAALVEPDGYILKPFEDRDLRVAIDLALARRRAASAAFPAGLDVISMCMTCRQVRLRLDEWMDLDEYLARRVGTRFSHGYCPTCQEKALDAVNRPKREDS
ncbi:MAG: response regulator [Vicinamibacterales bacterium]